MRAGRQREAPCASASATITGSSPGAAPLRSSSASCSAELLERSQLLRVRQIAVADVVDPPRERVHRAHRTAALARQQADAVVEVRGLRARDRLAAVVGLARVDRAAHADKDGAPGALSAAQRATRPLTRGSGRGASACGRALAERRQQRQQPASAGGLRRTREHVVAGALDRVERRAPAGDEGGDGEALTSAQLADQRRPRVEQRARRARPRRPARHAAAAASGAARRRVAICSTAAAEALEILERQVDASGGVVLGDVLAVLGELQRRADRVRQSDPLGRGGAEHAEHDLADRVGRERAVAAQLLPGPIARDALVGAVGLDQALERLARQRSRPATVCARRCISGCSAHVVRRRARVRLQPVERGQAIARRAVAELVDEAREAVHGQQVGAHAGAAARGWRRGSSRPRRVPSPPARSGPAARPRPAASSASATSHPAASERHHRKREPVEVVVDVVVGREAGARVLRLVPAAVGALGARPASRRRARSPRRSARPAPRAPRAAPAAPRRSARRCSGRARSTSGSS